MPLLQWNGTGVKMIDLLPDGQLPGMNRGTVVLQPGADPATNTVTDAELSCMQATIANELAAGTLVLISDKGVQETVAEELAPGPGMPAEE